MLCDVHIHFIPEELSAHTAFYRGIWTDKEKLYAFLDEHDIEKALLVFPSSDAHLKLGFLKVCALYNSTAAKLIRENKKIIAAGIVTMDNLKTAYGQIKKLKEEGFRVISIASSFEGKFLVSELIPVFEAAQNFGLCIFVHPQTINPIGYERVKDALLMPVLEYSFDLSMFMGLLMMEDVFERFNVPFIFSSLGGIVPFLKDRFDRIYSMLLERQMVRDLGRLPSQILKNIYVDTSAASLKNIQLALDLFGPEKILWGSDYPVCRDIEENIKMLDVLGIETKEKITFKNFQTLFG